MGAHLIEGEFQSDKYPTTPRGKVPLSTKDRTAQDLLWEYAQRRRVVDAEFSEDLETALRAAGYEPQPVETVFPRERRSAARARCEAATPGPWVGFGLSAAEHVDPDDMGDVLLILRDGPAVMTDADKAMAREARADLPDALDRIDQLDAEVRALRAECQRFEAKRAQADLTTLRASMDVETELESVMADIIDESGDRIRIKDIRAVLRPWVERAGVARALLRRTRRDPSAPLAHGLVVEIDAFFAGKPG